MTTRPILLPLLVLLLTACVTSSAASLPQSRDHLTQQEVDLVKDAQVLDQRIDVFVKAAERRLLILTGTTASNSKQLKKDSEKWGELPNGSRAELLGDIAKILDEAITNIDDVSARDEKNPLIAKALRKLAAEATRIFDQLRPLREQVKDDAEVAGFEQLTENAESILEAAKKLPPPVEKKAKNKGDKPKEED
ncbi:MAG: hypothetical protein ACREBG_27870 [Pyrinomonadaceae bacterium]